MKNVGSLYFSLHTLVHFLKKKVEFLSEIVHFCERILKVQLIFLLKITLFNVKIIIFNEKCLGCHISNSIRVCSRTCPKCSFSCWFKSRCNESILFYPKTKFDRNYGGRGTITNRKIRFTIYRTPRAAT